MPTENNFVMICFRIEVIVPDLDKVGSQNMSGCLVVVQVAYLEGALGVPRPGIRRYIVALPNLLSYSVEENLRPKVEYVVAVCKHGRK